MNIGSVARFARLPIAFAAVATWEKSFRRNPVIGSRRLNRAGLHVARIVVSHALFDLRLRLLSPLASPEDRRSFRENGFLVKEDFLPREEFEALRREVRAYTGEVLEIPEGDTVTERLILGPKERDELPHCKELVDREDLGRLMRYVSSKNRPPVFFLENLRLVPSGTGPRDPQKDLHTDTFHPCVKAWLYLDDVSAKNAPHVYVPGSNRLSWRRLAWEYRQSVEAAELAKRADRGNHYWDGSFRVREDDLRAMGYPEPRTFAVRANTLLVANTHGFHRRGDASEQSTRLTVWMQLRDNPFSPFVTPLPRLTGRVFEAIWQANARRVADAQRRAGRPPSTTRGFTT